MLFRSFIYHLQRTPAAAVQADGAPGEKGPGDSGDAGAGSIITKTFPVSAWVRKPGFFCKNADKSLTLFPFCTIIKIFCFINMIWRHENAIVEKGTCGSDCRGALSG